MKILVTLLVLLVMAAACAGDAVVGANGSDDDPAVVEPLPGLPPVDPTTGDSAADEPVSDVSVPNGPASDEPVSDEPDGPDPDDTADNPDDTVTHGVDDPPPVTVPTLPVPDALRGSVFVSETGITIAESWPIQVFVNVLGDAPTPCHTVQWEVAADDGVVAIELFSVDSGGICAQVLVPFDVSIPAGSFDSGDWIVTLNGDQVGEFTP